MFQEEVSSILVKWQINYFFVYEDRSKGYEFISKHDMMVPFFCFLLSANKICCALFAVSRAPNDGRVEEGVFSPGAAARGEQTDEKSSHAAVTFLTLTGPASENGMEI